jgi:hypothetical protein
MNPYMNDRSVLMLRHLVRADAALGQAAEQLMFASTGMLEAIQPHPTEETSTMEWIINTVPGMQEMAMLSLGAPDSFNMGTLVLMLARPSPLRIANRESGLHAVEGAYVTSHRIPPGARLREKPDRVRGLRLDPDKETRVLELVLTGPPAGKAHVLDDASQDIVFYSQNERCASSCPSHGWDSVAAVPAAFLLLWPRGRSRSLVGARADNPVGAPRRQSQGRHQRWPSPSCGRGPALPSPAAALGPAGTERSPVSGQRGTRTRR